MYIVYTRSKIVCVIYRGVSTNQRGFEYEYYGLNKVKVMYKTKFVKLYLFMWRVIKVCVLNVRYNNNCYTVPGTIYSYSIYIVLCIIYIGDFIFCRDFQTKNIGSDWLNVAVS